MTKNENRQSEKPDPEVKTNRRLFISPSDHQHLILPTIRHCHVSNKGIIEMRGLRRIGVLLLLLLLPTVRCSSESRVSDSLGDMVVGFAELGQESRGLRFIELETQRTLTYPSNVNVTCPSWSSDFTMFVFAQDDRLHIHSVEIGSTTVITTEYARLGALAWSPDDAGIAFAAQTESNVYGMDLWYLDLSSQYLSLLADCTSPKTSGYSCDSPTWSDDHQLAYVRRTDPAQARVEVLDIPSGEIETWVDEISLLYPDVPLGTDDSSEGSACSVLSISPDGRHLALVVGRGSGTLPFGADLYVLDISTRALRGVTLKRSWSDCPKWIDNHRVVFRIISWGKGTGLLNPSELVVNQKHQIAVVDIHTRSGARIAETIFSDDIKVGCPFTIPMSSVKRLVGLQ